MKKEKVIPVVVIAILIAAIFAQGAVRLYLTGLLFILLSISSWIDAKIDPYGRYFMVDRGGFWSCTKKKTVAIFESICTIIYLIFLLHKLLG